MEYLSELKLPQKSKDCLKALVRAKAEKKSGLTIPEMLAAGNYSCMPLLYQVLPVWVGQGWVKKIKTLGQRTMYEADLDKISISPEFDAEVFVEQIEFQKQAERAG